MRPISILAGCWLAAVAAGCVDPLVTDTVDRSELVLPAGSEVRSAAEDPDLLARIDADDGIDGDIVWALEGFWDDRVVTWWDFGPASPLPIPLYMLVEEAPEGQFEARGKRYDPVPEHFPIFDKVTGDAGYSPWWEVVLVPVTDRYQGEILPSFAAVDEAERQGLVEVPIPMPMAVNCPVVLPTARLEEWPGGPLREPNRAYFRNRIVYYFSFDTIETDGPMVAVPSVYQLRREGGEPLSEVVRGVDINGDGDVQDTNDVFAEGPGDAGYTGMVALVDVVVTADTAAIDDEEGSEITSVYDLFTTEGDVWEPRPEHVVAVYPDRVALNRPIATPAQTD